MVFTRIYVALTDGHKISTLALPRIDYGIGIEITPNKGTVVLASNSQVKQNLFLPHITLTFARNFEDTFRAISCAKMMKIQENFGAFFKICNFLYYAYFPH